MEPFKQDGKDHMKAVTERVERETDVAVVEERRRCIWAVNSRGMDVEWMLVRVWPRACQ